MTAPEALYGVLLALKSAGIEVVEPVEDAEPADREPPDSKDGADQRGMLESADRAAATSDPVRLYLKQIGTVALLTAADEVELSKAIEAGLFAAERLAEPALSGFPGGERSPRLGAAVRARPRDRSL